MRRDFLGPTVAAPVPATGVAPMGEGRAGGPVGCLACGTTPSPGRLGGWLCTGCSPVGANVSDSQWMLLKAWKAGARDFPRRRAAPTRENVCSLCAALWSKCTCSIVDKVSCAPAVEPARPTRRRCEATGCNDVSAHAGVTLCERHIGEAMVFSDGCRLKPDLFPASKPPGRFQQSHVLGAGLGLWSLRDEGTK